MPGIVGVEGHEARPPVVGLELAELREEALQAGVRRPPVRLALRPEGGALAAELQAAVAMMHADARQQAARIRHRLAAGQDRLGDVVAQRDGWRTGRRVPARWWRAARATDCRCRRWCRGRRGRPRPRLVRVASFHLPPSRASPRGARAFVQRGAGLDRRAGEAAHIGERIDLAAPPVDRGAEIVVAADHVGGLPAVQQLDRSAARLPVGDALGMGAQRLLGVGCHDDAGHGIVAIDAVALDQLAQDHGALVGGINQPLAGGGAVAGDDLVGIVLGGGRQMAGIAAGGAPADLVGFDENDPRASLGGMERGRASGDAAPSA